MAETHRACYLCGNKASPMHALPKNEEQRNKWLEFIFGTLPVKYTATLALCCDHFNLSDFMNLGAYKSGFALRLFLNPGSVPSRRSKAVSS